MVVVCFFFFEWLKCVLLLWYILKCVRIGNVLISDDCKVVFFCFFENGLLLYIFDYDGYLW